MQCIFLSTQRYLLLQSSHSSNNRKLNVYFKNDTSLCVFSSNAKALRPRAHTIDFSNNALVIIVAHMEKTEVTLLREGRLAKVAGNTVATVAEMGRLS